MRIGLDLDGVLCRTPFGRLAVHAPAPVPALPSEYERLYDAPARSNPLRSAIEYLRFGWRSVAADAPETLTLLSSAHELWIVTGRSGVGEGILRKWLHQHGLEAQPSGICMAPRGLRPAQHKLATARMLKLDAHIDDDPRTAYYLAENGVQHVYLLDHAGAHGEAPLPPHVTLVRSLRDFAAKVESS
jgi:hypothetical protein